MFDKIIDIYDENTITDGKLFTSNGPWVIISKATEGTTVNDSLFLARKLLAKANNYPFGAYHFGRANDPVKEAEFFLKFVKPDGTFALFLDLEASMSISQAETFCDYVEKQTGQEIGIYTRASYIEELIGNKQTSLSTRRLWVASYIASPVLPPQWKEWFLWQYTDEIYGVGELKTPGISAADRSKFNGTLDQLRTVWVKLINPTRGNPPESNKNLKQLNVPYSSQDDSNSNLFKDDCGPACIRMLMQFKGISPLPTVNQLSEQTTLTSKDDGLYIQQLVDLGNRNGLNLSLSSGLDLPGIRAQIDLGIPCISLIEYGAIPGREDAKFTGLHFVVVTGYDDDSFYINDPDWLEASGGTNFKVLNSAFESALYKNQGVIFGTAETTNIVTRYVTATILNIRNSPEIKDNVIGQLKNGEKVSVDLNQQKTYLTTAFVPLMGKAGWVALSYLSQNPPVSVVSSPMPPPMPQHQPIGLHIMPGANRDLVFDLLRTGKIKGVTLVRSGWQNEIKVSEIKQCSENIKVLLRWYASGWENRQIDWSNPNLAAVGDQWVNDYVYRGLFSGDPVDSLLADYHQIINEPGYGLGTSAFWLGALGAANRIKIKLGVFCFSNGNPPLPNEDNSPWPSLYPVMRQAKDQGHVMMLHQYTLPERGGNWDEPWGIMRHKKLYSMLPDDLKQMPLVVGEFGDRYALGKGIPNFINNVKIASDQLKPDSFIISSNLWTVGGMGAWTSDLIDAALPDLKSYLVSL